MEIKNDIKQRQFNRLNKMLDLADKTGSTSDMVNVNDDTQYINETTLHSIIHTPMKNQNILSEIKGNTMKDVDLASVYTEALGSKKINVTKDLQIKPPMRSKDRPVSSDTSSISSELNSILSRERSLSLSPSKNKRLPLSPRKFDLSKEKNQTKRQSLENVQDKLSEQLEELKSIASGNDGTDRESMTFDKPQRDIPESVVESTDSLDNYFSAVNTIDEDLDIAELKGSFVHSGSFNKPLNTVVKKISVPVFTQSDGINKKKDQDEDITETNDIDDDDEYEDIESEYESPQSNKNFKKSRKRQVKAPTHNFNVNTIENLMGSMEQVNDFDHLGMRDEEKKYLQLLVNNLSKLTADMIIDPSKYEEGIRRLKKAALALEGF